jgi:drug/metabolite transporter (DMT)-like permease
VSGAALALVLSAALVHAGWNRLLHGAADRLAAAAVGAVAGAAVLAPATAVFPPVRAWPLVAASGAAEAAYFISLSAAYQRGELSLTYPVARGTAPFLVTLGGAALLGQPLTAGRVAGSLALGAGLALISRAGLASGRGRALGFALLTGVVIATYSVIDARAVREASPAGYLGAVTAVEAALLLAAARWLPGPAGRAGAGRGTPGDRGTLSDRGAPSDRGTPGGSGGYWARLRAAVPAGTGVGIGSLAAYLLVLFAFQRAPAGPVATLRELSILAGILLSGDRPGRWVWLGGALCVAGAVLVTL